MPKTREQKEKLIAGLTEKFGKAKSAVLFDYKGLKVKETEDLRKLLRDKSAEVIISKNTLVKIALSNTGIVVRDDILDKPLAIAFAYEDEIIPVKEIDLFAKKHEALEILGGIIENQFIDEFAVSRLAKLPSREELYAKMVGSIAAPLSGMVNVLAGNIRGLVTVLSAYRDKK